jgi:hypothetical protein
MPNEPTDTERLNFLIDHNADLTQQDSWKGRFWVTLPDGRMFFADDARKVIDEAMEKLNSSRVISTGPTEVVI